MRDPAAVLRVLVPLLLWVLPALLATTRAAGYVQTHAPGSPVPGRWRKARVTLTWSPSDLPEGLAPRKVRAALRSAASTWSHDAVPCTAMRVVVVEGARRVHGGVRDGVSSVVFHRRRFCKRGVDRPGQCYDPRIAAMTGLHFDRSRRWIVEADIELNAVTFDFGATANERSETTPHRRSAPSSGGAASGAAKPARVPLDLESLLVHEIGHVLGFAHPCTRARSAWLKVHDPGPLPATGAAGAATACRSAQKAVRKSMMVPFADELGGLVRPGPRAARRLPAFDRAGLCAVYPG